MLDYAHSALLLLIIPISFCFNLFLGECNAGGPERVAQHLGELPEAIRSAVCGQADTWQYEDRS